MQTLNMILLAKHFVSILKSILKWRVFFCLLLTYLLFLSCLSFYSPRQVTAVLFSTRNNLPGPPAYKTLTQGTALIGNSLCGEGRGTLGFIFSHRKLLSLSSAGAGMEGVGLQGEIWK